MKILGSIVILGLFAGTSLAHAASPDRTIRGSVPAVAKMLTPLRTHDGRRNLDATFTVRLSKYPDAGPPLQRAVAWARAQKLTVKTINVTTGDINVKATTARLAAAFKTQINDYQYAGAVHFGNGKAVTVPRALSISKVSGLDDFSTVEK